MYGEVRTALETAQLVIDLDAFQRTRRTHSFEAVETNANGKGRITNHNYELNITSDQISIHSTLQGPKTIYLFPSDLQVVPQSCSSMNWVDGDGLHVRIQVSKSGGLLSPTEGSDVDWTLTGEQLAYLACRTCELKLTSKVLKTITSMPSDDWQGILEELWCCRSKDIAGAPPELRKSPRYDECLSGPFELVMSSSQLIEDIVVINEAKPAKTNRKLSKAVTVVECSRCQSLLGSIVELDKSEANAIHFWKFQTSLYCDEDEKISKHSNSLEHLVAVYLQEQIKSHISFKFMVESEDHEAQILLWMISPDSLLLQSGRSTDSEEGVSTRVKNVQCTPIMKLLYQTCWDDKGQALKAEWSRDMMVRSFSLPMSACYQLAEILHESTTQTPLSMRTMNGLMIGFLKTS